MKPLAPLDIECYIDYFIVKLMRLDTGAVRQFEMWPGRPLDIASLQYTLARVTSITFNGIDYDMPMIGMALQGADCARLKAASDEIILGGLRGWEFTRKYNCEVNFDHIDLIEVAPGQASLKLYAGKMHCKKMQDLPIEPSASITPADRIDLAIYCGNDLHNTASLRDKFKDQIALREKMSIEYGIDLRSKSDAQVAEAVIRSKVSMLMGFRVQKPEFVERTFKYKIPAFMANAGRTVSALVDEIRNVTFVVNHKGKVEMPAALNNRKVAIGNSVYVMGIGGLHSSEKSKTHYADDKTLLIDRDVASYYPKIIDVTGLYPQHLGTHFLGVYRDIIAKRLEAKAKKNKVVADMFKIVLNGSFGKFGNVWSTLYAPDLMLQVTLTGQLALLMLIEAIEAWGIPVVSANTDGIVMKCPADKKDVLDLVIATWERRTGFETEETRYRALHSRDVNSYIAIKPDGSVKTKGEYAPPEPVGSSWPSPTFTICTKAAIEFLTKGTPIALTVRSCKDIREFVSIQKVAGGAMWRGQYLGKSIRWYIAWDQFGAIHYKNENKAGNHNKVSLTDGAQPCMELPDEFPINVNHEWYIARAEQILKDVGFAPLAAAPVQETMALFA